MFDPHSTARQVLTTTNLTDPADIADAVFDRTPEAAIRDAYRHLLRRVALDAIRMDRMTANEADPVVEPRRAPNRSPKVAAIRARHSQYLAQRVFALGVWKQLGDCTLEDVLDLAAQRREVAAQNAAQAERFEALAARMRTSGAGTVAALGAEAVAA